MQQVAWIPKYIWQWKNLIPKECIPYDPIYVITEQEGILTESGLVMVQSQHWVKDVVS